jgi:hypothetical protein
LIYFGTFEMLQSKARFTKVKPAIIIFKLKFVGVELGEYQP